MNKILSLLLPLFFMGSFFNCAWAQDPLLPKVINISNNSKVLEELSSKYESSLFIASDTNVVKTMQNWKHLLTAMEIYAEDIQFNLKGVKMWLKVFWAKDGTIDYITYYLSDNSINIDQMDLEAFLRSFMRNYALPQSHKHRFSYDARVMFPLYLMR